jgi:hypothetical protein
MPVMLVLAGLSTPAQALEHTVGARFRTGFVPNGVMDIWYFNSDDEGALPLERPSPAALMYGLEYTLAVQEKGGPSVQFYVERIDINMEEGYWDDKESPADHTDGDWLQPNKAFGAWGFGVDYVQEVPLSETAQPVWVSLNFGGGVGFGVSTGEVKVWKAQLNDDVVDPNCPSNDTDALSPERAGVCVNDGLLKVPGIVPIVDIVTGPEVHFGDHVSVRLDLGWHLLALYGGLAAGAVF